MSHVLQAEGFLRSPLEVRRTVGGGYKLYQGGQALKGKRGKFTVVRDDGVQVEAELERRALGLDFPVVNVGGRAHEVVPPLPTGVLIVACLPMLLIIGGVIGALCGVAATIFNLWVVRTEQPAIVRYALIVVSLVVAVGLYLLIASSINNAVA